MPPWLPRPLLPEEEEDDVVALAPVLLVVFFDEGMARFGWEVVVDLM